MWLCASFRTERSVFLTASINLLPILDSLPPHSLHSTVTDDYIVNVAQRLEPVTDGRTDREKRAVADMNIPDNPGWPAKPLPLQAPGSHCF